MDRFTDVFEMKYNGEHIKDAMLEFFYREIQCSSCKYSGLTRAILYDMPEYLVLDCKTEDMACIQLIDEVDFLTIKSSMEIPTFEYSANTVFIVVERNEMFYLQKKQDGFVYYDKQSKRFEHLKDISTHHINAAASWVVFIYKTDHDLFKLPDLQKSNLGQEHFLEATEPDLLSVATIQSLLPIFTERFDIGNIMMQKKHFNNLLDNHGDLDDLIIDAYLYELALFSPSSTSILAVPVHRVSIIVEKKFETF